MPAPTRDPDPRLPYQLPMPAEMSPDLVVAPVLPDDDRVWVPQADNVWFRPLCLNASQGYWVNLLKVGRAEKVSRFRLRTAAMGKRYYQMYLEWVEESLSMLENGELRPSPPSPTP